jgi:hypothetical protein
MFAGRPFDIFDDLLARAFACSSCLSHLPLLSGYDEPRTLSYQITLFGPTSADVRQFEEFETAIDWWGHEADGFQARVETEQAWKVSAEDLVARGYNFDLKNPHVGDAVNHDPDELLANFVTTQNEIQSLRDQLKAILSDALNGARP